MTNIDRTNRVCGLPGGHYKEEIRSHNFSQLFKLTIEMGQQLVSHKKDTKEHCVAPSVRAAGSRDHIYIYMGQFTTK